MVKTYKLLQVENLNTSFKIDAGKVLAVNGVSFSLDKGKVLGIVGESGSGKSVTAYSIMQILDKNGHIDSGKIIYNGTDLLKLKEEEMREIRGNKISIIFQDAMTSLNPTWTIGNQLREAILTHAKDPVELECYDLINDVKSDEQRIASIKKGIANHPERVELVSDLKFVEEKLIKDKKDLEEKIKVTKVKYEKLKKEKEQEYKDGVGKFDQAIKEARSNYWKNFFKLNPKPTDEEINKVESVINAQNKVHASEHALEEVLSTYKDDKEAIRSAKENLFKAKNKLNKEIRNVRNNIIYSPRHERKNKLVEAKNKKTEFYWECVSAYKETKYSANKKALHMLEEVGITEPVKRLNQYPFELSGGMLQRCMIAMALVERPDILIADEPTTALDVTIQAQILELLKKLQKEYGMAIIIITHDLGVVAQICDEVDIMYAGRIVERGTVDEVFYNPQHEYTKGLINSMPKLNSKKDSLTPIQGNPVDLFCLPKGCAFSSRCKKCMKICIEKYPEEIKCNSTGHSTSCWATVKELHDKKQIDVVKGKPEGKPLVYNGAIIHQGEFKGGVIYGKKRNHHRKANYL